MHQLVIQFPEDAFPGFDALVNFEDMLIDALGDRHAVDGPNAATVAEIRDRY